MRQKKQPIIKNNVAHICISRFIDRSYICSTFCDIPYPMLQLHTNNVRVKGERTDVLCPQKWTSTDRDPPFIVGEEVLLLAQNL